MDLPAFSDVNKTNCDNTWTAFNDEELTIKLF